MSAQLLQLLGDFIPQTPDRGFAPGTNWGMTTSRPPDPQMKILGGATVYKTCYKSLSSPADQTVQLYRHIHSQIVVIRGRQNIISIKYQTPKTWIKIGEVFAARDLLQRTVYRTKFKK